jgi:hypothetical protein
MTKKETINRNIGLTFDFVKYLIDNPDILDKLPDNFKLEFIEKDFINIENKSQKPIKNQKEKIVRIKNSFELV